MYYSNKWATNVFIHPEVDTFSFFGDVIYKRTVSPVDDKRLLLQWRVAPGLPEDSIHLCTDCEEEETCVLASLDDNTLVMPRPQCSQFSVTGQLANISDYQNDVEKHGENFDFLMDPKLLVSVWVVL